MWHIIIWSEDDLTDVDGNMYIFIDLIGRDAMLCVSTWCNAYCIAFLPDLSATDGLHSPKGKKKKEGRLQHKKRLCNIMFCKAFFCVYSSNGRDAMHCVSTRCNTLRLYAFLGIVPNIWSHS